MFLKFFAPIFCLLFCPSLFAAPAPLQLIVMDPLALQLSCACVKGTGQRRYNDLAAHLEKSLGRPVKVTYDESLELARQQTRGVADLIIGQDSVVRGDAAKLKLAVRPLAALTNQRGDTTLKGVFLVRKNFPARSLAHLAGKRVSLGPVEDEETHAAAQRALAAANIHANFRTAASIDAAALAMNDGETDAAVVSDFLPPLLEGCGKLDRGSFQIIGETESVPFIRVFASDAVDAALEAKITRALFDVAKDAKLLAALESKSGFVPLREEAVTAWTDWRGPGRAGFVPQLPRALPDQLSPLWATMLTGPAMAGVAATEQFVVVPDKSADFQKDVFSCLDAKTGGVRWQLAYAAPEEVDYSNAPRATPVIHDGLVYLQGALGHLHCVELATGKVIWKANVFADFGAQRITWGCSIAPLVVDDKLIIAPGAKDAAVVALDRKTGKVIWKTPGHAAAYSAFISGTFDGVRQIIGFDVAGIGGWDPATGKRLWEVVPTDGADFNVITPVVLGDQLLLAGENNATRLHKFDGHGKLVAAPVLKNKDLAPDTCTPVVVNGKIFGTAYGDLFCVDATTLKTLWRQTDEMFHDHVTLVAGKDRVLVWTMSGDLLLLDATAAEYKVISKLRPFTDKHPDSMAHPAFVGDRMYLRSKTQLICVRLPSP
ncbi:MAG: PQQ-binding-like beta-propeller repeat protein [Verrucomicrobia bacterium]|nr:PQQ-binding-like beta-propeller repeat protein [Verrucomicrobiota bacterium]